MIIIKKPGLIIYEVGRIKSLKETKRKKISLLKKLDYKQKKNIEEIEKPKLIIYEVGKTLRLENAKRMEI